MQNVNFEVKQARLISLFWVFFKVGTLSFGGGVIAYLREYIVMQQQWVTDQAFFNALEISQTLPGITPINLAVVIGDIKKSAWGSFVAVMGLIIPGVIFILVFGGFYIHYINNAHLAALLMGVAAAATGFIFKIACEFGRAQIRRFFDFLLMGLSFFAVGVWHIPLVIVLLVLAPLGIYFYRPRFDKDN